jgi:uncharacterized SAM-dependent methyltransferase
VGQDTTMKYFKNTELAKLYNVSEKSVRNWIEAARQGKLDLQLIAEGDRYYIANTTKNSLAIEHLVDKGKKYKNSRGYRQITPSPAFYELFDSKEILDITSNLDIYHEIPLQYCYFDDGASIWDAYVQKLSHEQSPNILANTIELLDLNLAYIEGLVKGTGRVNIIDIGPGNGYPVRKFLEHFMSTGRLNRYIGIDVSRDMLDIAEHNIRAWFNDKIEFEGHIRDIAHERFNDLLAIDTFNKEDPVQNIVLFLGSTLSNFRDPGQPLAAIHESMGKRDLLIFSKQLDTPNARRYFDFDIDTNSKAKLSPLGRFTFETLGIDESLYDVEQFFDTEHMARRLQIRLTVALSIEFQLGGKTKVINFNKGDVILFWRHRHQGALETIQQFNANGFNLLQAITSVDGECLLSISNIKTDVE